MHLYPALPMHPYPEPAGEMNLANFVFPPYRRVAAPEPIENT